MEQFIIILYQNLDNKAISQCSTNKKSEVKAIIMVPNYRFIHASSFIEVGDNVLHVAIVGKLSQLSSEFYM
jgi:hypothetical protein